VRWKRGPFRDFRFEELVREHVRLAVPPNHPFARRRSVSLADAAQETIHRTYARRFSGLSRVSRQPVRFGKKNKPRVIQEHDGMTSVVSAVEAGTGVAVAVEALGYAFGNRVKLVRLTPEPKPISFGIAARKRNDSVQQPRKFWQMRERGGVKKNDRRLDHVTPIRCLRSSSEARLNHTAIHPKGGAVGRGGQGAAHVRHQIGYLFGRRKPLQE